MDSQEAKKVGAIDHGLSKEIKIKHSMANNNSISKAAVAQETLEDSMDDLLKSVYIRCVQLAYMPDLMTTRQQPRGMPDLLWDSVWSYADGLNQKRIFGMLNGMCSLQSALSFDLEDEENQLKKDLEYFNKYTPGDRNLERVY